MSTPESSPPRNVVVIGGSVAGLACATALSQAGHRVTVLERDATPLPATPIEAFEQWDRRGSPQVRHSHAFLARLHNLLRDRVPELLASLKEHGAEELRFADMIRSEFPDAELTKEDEEITLLACRRTTFEWVMRRFVLDSGRVDFRDGVEVEGLEATRDEATGLPRVHGVRVRPAGRLHKDDAAEILEADLVLDCSGRRSKLPHWLEAIGAAPLEEDSEPCGIFYSSRFYRLRPGVEKPDERGVRAVDLGYLKCGLFPGDHDIFSLTLCGSPDDPAMRQLLRLEGFEAAANAVPEIRPWVAPELAEPITGVHPMGDLKNTRRHFVTDGVPLALGVLPVGDALIHTNPISGRGCTFAWLHAYFVADRLAEHPDDLQALAAAVAADVEREIVPWYYASLSQDRDAMEVDRITIEGKDPFAFQSQDGTVDPKAYMRAVLRDGLLPALREDLELLRAFMRAFNLLDEPANLMKRPDLFSRVLASFNRRDARPPEEHGPSRSEMVALLERSCETPPERAA